MKKVVYLKREGANKNKIKFGYQLITKCLKENIILI